MPQLVIAAVAFGASALGIALSATAASIIGYGITIAGAGALASRQRRRAQAKARAAYNASLKDREVLIRSAVAPRVRLYGRDRVSGQLVHAESTGAKREFLHIVIKLADHECDAIEQVWFGDVLLPDPDVNGFIQSGEFAAAKQRSAVETVTSNGAGVATLSRAAAAVNSATVPDTDAWAPPSAVGFGHTPGAATVTGLPPSTAVTIGYTWNEGKALVRIRKHLGGAGQVADLELVAASAGKWTVNHVGVGICYAYVRVEYDQDVFGQVGLPEMTFVVRGAKVADPRTSTVAWSSNWALCVADYLKQADGMAAAPAAVPDSEVIAAANISDELVTLTAGGATQKRYEINTTISTAQAPRDALEDMLDAGAGRCVWTQGRWLLRPGAYRTPAPALGVDDLAGYAEVLPARSRDERFNAVRVTYRDPSQGWAEVQAPLVTNTLYETEDGGVRVVRDLQLDSAMDAMRAQRLGKIELERSRQALRVSAPFNLRAYDLAPTDTVPLDWPRYGWSGKVFEVLERAQATNGRLQYVLQETAAGVYAWNFGEATTVDLAPDTNLPNPYAKPATLAGLAVASGTAHLVRAIDGTIQARARVSWTQTTEAFVLSGGLIRVQWRVGLSDEWQSAADLPGDATATYLGPLPAGQPIVVRVWAVNSLGRQGDAAYQVHVVVGKTQPPANVSGLATTTVSAGVRISWTGLASIELDYAATELRVGASWAAGTLLFRGASAEYLWTNPPAGSYTVWARHFDDSGNESVAPASVAVVVDSGSFVIDGAAQLVGTRVTKTGVTNDWDASVRSKHGFEGGAIASALVLRNDLEVGLGLNTDPTTNASYDSIDFWLYARTDGQLEVYESAASRGIVGTYAAGDRLSVHYDGVNVRYYRNASVLRTVAASIALPLHFDSSLRSPGVVLDDLQFQAQSKVSDIGTGQLQPNAATEVYVATAANVSVTSNDTVPEWSGGSTLLTEVVFNPSVTGDALVTFFGAVDLTTAAGGGGGFLKTAFYVNGVRDTTSTVYHVEGSSAASVTTRSSIAYTKRVSVTAGVPYTLSLRAKRLAPETVLVTNIEGRVEIIKR
jgi:hypothetical protein